MKLFISHATSDKVITRAFVDMLYAIGMKQEDMFCSSVPEIGIPIKQDIYSYIKEIFTSDSLYVVFMLSSQYYKSVACLNEMGATWITQTEYVSILLPGFEFENIKGAVNPQQVAIKLDTETAKFQLNELKKDLENKFNLHAINESRWERIKENFLNVLEDKDEETPYFDISNCRAYCIGDQISRGCKIMDVNSRENRISASINFAHTSQDICSVVIFPKIHDWRKYANNGFSLSFKVKSNTSEPFVMILEIKRRDLPGHVRRPIVVNSTCDLYRYPLIDLDKESEWEFVEEVCFLAERDNTPDSFELTITDLKIKK